MTYHRYARLILAAFCVLLFSFTGCGPKEDKKGNVTADQEKPVSYTHLTLPTNREV